MDILEQVKALCGCRKKVLKCLLLGAQSSGKTTFLYKTKLGEVVTTVPTIGFNVETVKLNRDEITVWDVGGVDRIMPLWRHYFEYLENGLIFFIGNRNDQDFQ